MGDLPDVASKCQRPSGFMLPPPEQKNFNDIFSRILADYSALTGTADESFISLQCGGTTHRLSISMIDYVEALDKRLNIYTARQSLTVYASLGKLEESLGEGFFRCHRSYLVNYAHIAKVDFAAMELKMQSGARIPLSRSAKDRLKQRVRQEGARE